MRSLKTELKKTQLGKNTMTKFRKAPYGYICDSLSNAGFSQSMVMVRERLEAANNDHGIRVIPDIALFALETFKIMSGTNLRDFLVANYDNGMGVRSYLVTNIMKYLNNEISSAQLTSIIKMDINNVSNYLKTRTTPLPKINYGSVQEADTVIKLKQVRNDGYFKILSAVGPVKLLELMLTFNMEV